MKKKLIIVTTMALSLFSGAAIAGAAGTGLLGAKVQGLFSVEVNGKEINDAVVINGSTYIPVRSLSESLGAGLSVTGKKVVITTETQSPTEAEIVQQGKKNGIKSQINSKQLQIENLQKQIGYYQGYYNDAKSTFDKNANDPIYKENGVKFEDSAAYRVLTDQMDRYQAEIDKMDSEVNQLNTDIDDLTAQLNDLN